MKKNLLLFIFIMFTLLLIPEKTLGSPSYNYTPWGNVIESASSMTASKVIDNSNLVDEFSNKTSIELGVITDIFTYENKVYVVNSSKNQILVLNDQFQLIDTFPKMENDVVLEGYELNKPNGIYIRDKKLYVCDQENERIVIFDTETKDMILEIKNPDDPTFETTKFKPEKIAVDRTGRMFVIGFDIFEGIMDFNPDGSFSRFYGTNTITLNIFEALLYKFSSQQQKEKQALKLQSSFENLDIDANGYVYAVSGPDVFDVIKKLNYKGKDILNKNGYVLPIGDVSYVTSNDDVPSGRSNLVDVAVSPNGNMYSVLDSKRGRVFTYDNEGNLLYIFGKIGSQTSMFKKPVSLTYFDDKVLVADSMYNSITVFEPTEFGELINGANNLYLNAKYTEAKEEWEKVLKLNSNYFLAYAGIGKAQLREGNYEEAMKNLKLGYDYYNYSKAYEQYRNESLDRILPWVLVAGFVVVGYLFFKSMKSAIIRDNEGRE